MNEGGHRFKLLFAGSALIAFAMFATLAITWLPIFPEAAAVTSEADYSGLDQYILWHQSWRTDSATVANACFE